MSSKLRMKTTSYFTPFLVFLLFTLIKLMLAENTLLKLTSFGVLNREPLQILLLILSKFKQITSIPLKTSENLRFF